MLAARLSQDAQAQVERDGSAAANWPEVLTPVPTLGPACADAPVRDADALDALAVEEALRQAHKMETIGRCVGEFAHDFNNLLTVIIGNLDRASHTAAPGTRAFAYLANATLATERAASLVGDILAFSRGQAAISRLVDIDNLVVAMRPLIASVSAGCAVDLEIGCGGWLCRADANQLENAVLNLVLNARDAMPDGGRLTVTTFAAGAGDGLEPTGDRVGLMVTDTGVGMEPHIVARAFDPFFTTKPAGRGTGLGLAQIAGFASRTAGCVRIDSIPGTGTRVTLLLPRAECAPFQAPAFDPNERTRLTATCPEREPPANTQM